MSTTFVLRHAAGVGDDDDRIDESGDGDRVGHGQDRWRVDDDEVVVLTHLIEDPLHPTAAEHLARVGGDRAGHIDRDPVLHADLDHRDDVFRCGAEEDVGETGGRWDVEHLVDPGAAQVGVDERNPMSRPSQHDGEVRRRRRLALAGERAGDLHDMDAAVEREELDVRAEAAIRLDRHMGRIRHRKREIAGRWVDGDLGEDRTIGQRFEIIRGPDLVVEIVDEERRSETEQQADDEGQRGSS